MTEIICINDKYKKEKLEFFSKHGVKYPEEGKIYNIREVIKHSSGEIGLRVQEIQNPEVPIKHSVLKVIYYEPTFYYKRFAHLNDDVVTEEEIKEWMKETKKEKI